MDGWVDGGMDRNGKMYVDIKLIRIRSGAGADQGFRPMKDPFTHRKGSVTFIDFSSLSFAALFSLSLACILSPALSSFFVLLRYLLVQR